MKKKKKRQKDEFWIEIYRIPQSWASHVSINKITIQLFHIQNESYIIGCVRFFIGDPY